MAGKLTRMSSSSSRSRDSCEDSNGQRKESAGGRSSNGDRVRHSNGYRQRAASFCARLASPAENGILDGAEGVVIDTVNSIMKWPPKLAGLEVLMVSASTAGESYWVLPGGGVENAESTEEAVIRELREEAGILGKVLFYVGEFVDDKRFHHTTLYFLTVVEVFMEWGENCENGRQRRWMRMDEARRHIKSTQLDMLEQGIEIIERTLGDCLQPSIRNSLLSSHIVSRLSDSHAQLHLPSDNASVIKLTALPMLTNGTGNRPEHTKNGTEPNAKDQEQQQQHCTALPPTPAKTDACT